MLVLSFFNSVDITITFSTLIELFSVQLQFLRLKENGRKSKQFFDIQSLSCIEIMHLSLENAPKGILKTSYLMFHSHLDGRPL